MQEEFNAFLETVSDKPETRMAFLLLYWTGMRIGELLALTYNDINLEEKTMECTECEMSAPGAYDIDIEADDINVIDTATVIWEIA